MLRGIGTALLWLVGTGAGTALLLLPTLLLLPVPCLLPPLMLQDRGLQSAAAALHSTRVLGFGAVAACLCCC